MSSKYVRPAAEGADPFGTARLRRGVIDAWATSPARFREDANAEEDLVLGGYRDRLVIKRRRTPPTPPPAPGCRAACASPSATAC